MVVEITSKDELQTVAEKFKNVSVQLTSETADIVGNLSGVEDFDGINISQAATTIQNNLKNISGEIETLASSLGNYVADIKNLDTYDLQAHEETQDSSGQSQGSNNGNNANGNDNTHFSNESVVSSFDSMSSGNLERNNNNSKNVLQADGIIEITSEDSNYDLGDRYYEYVEPIFQMTTGNLAYEVSDKDFDLLCAIVSAESDKSYDGSLAVMSTILNRCEHPNYVASYGASPIAQATAYNQFAGYSSNEYKQYTNGQYPETVVQAVKDALAGVRNHTICDFSNNSSVAL